MQFKTVSNYLERLENTSSRLEMTSILAELFSKVSSDEITPLCYLLLGSIAPKYKGIEFQIADKLMIRIIANTYGVSVEHVLSEFKSKGDMGLVAETLAKKKSSTNTPSIQNVYEDLCAIANEEGAGSVERKIFEFSKLLQTLDWLSVRYMVRIPLGTMRLGFSDMTLLDALSWTKTGDKTLRVQLERAFNVACDIGLIARVFKEKGIEGIAKIKPTPGVPIRSVRAERLPDAKTIIEKLGECAVEPKLDGFRAQVHIIKRSNEQMSKKAKTEQQTLLTAKKEQSKNTVEIFSRNMENTTLMFPEIAEAFQKLDVTSAIVDGEAIGFDPKTGKHLPFQETIQRKRKFEIERLRKIVPLRYYAFDILELNGESLLDKSFRERRNVLEEEIGKLGNWEIGKTIALTKQTIISKPEELIKLFDESVKDGFEGIMVKKLDSPYTAGARNYNWVKFKHTGRGKLADTLDCLVMGYYKGEGKRSGFGIGAFLVGVKSNYKLRITNYEYKTIAKIGTGLSDKQWKALRESCGKYAVKNKPDEYDVPKSLIPDGWVIPSIVVEIAADELTKTPLHSAGLALRFPRLISFRTDKSAEDVTTIGEVEKLYHFQNKK